MRAGVGTSAPNVGCPYEFRPVCGAISKVCTSKARSAGSMGIASSSLRRWRNKRLPPRIFYVKLDHMGSNSRAIVPRPAKVHNALLNTTRLVHNRGIFRLDLERDHRCRRRARVCLDRPVIGIEDILMIAAIDDHIRASIMQRYNERVKKSGINAPPPLISQRKRIDPGGPLHQRITEQFGYRHISS